MLYFYNHCYKVIRFTIFFLSVTTLSSNTFSQPVISFNTVVSSGLSSPIDLVNAGDGTGRLFVAQQNGTIRVYDGSFIYIGNFLTVAGISTGGERGLLSMAFSPDYATNGFFYVYYTNTDGDVEVARYHVSGDPDVADPSSKVVVITIPHPGESNHNGGKLNFGNDGYLYFATGDGGGGGDVPNNAQNGNSLLGKMLRIDVNDSATPPYYTIPADNPFVGNGAVSDEIWALGLRNPFRWSFDRQTHDIWIGDVGQGDWEEIDFATAGSTGGINYGWRCYEGNSPYNTAGCNAMPNYLFPVYVYPNPVSGSSAVTGGVVYRGSTYTSLQGYYIASDFYSGDLFLVKPDGTGGWTTTVQTGLLSSIACFGEAEDGEVYAVSLGGSIYEVSVSGVLPVTLIDFSAQQKNNGFINLSWKTTNEENTLQFVIEFSTNGVNYAEAGIVPATNSPTGSTYSFNHLIEYNGRISYRIKMQDRDGIFLYSKVIQLVNQGITGNFIYPTIVTNGNISLFLSESFKSLQIIGINGSIITERNIQGRTGRLNIPVNFLSKGTYFVQLRNNSSAIVQKFIVK